MNFTEFKGLIIRNYHTAKIISTSTSDRVITVKKWLIKEHYGTVCRFCPPYQGGEGFSQKRLTNLILEILF